jgi:hypothetical protein
MTRTRTCNLALSLASSFIAILILLTAEASAQRRFLPAVAYGSGGQYGSWVAMAQQPSLAPAPAVNFARAISYFTGGANALSVAVGDVNGDGKIDAVVANWGGSCGQCLEGSVGVLLGKGDGTFQPAVAYGSGAYLAWAVALSDLNNDGKLDIMVTSCFDPVCGTGAAAGVLLGNGDGTFQTAVVYSAGPPAPGLAPEWSAVADVNVDHKPDLLVSNVGGVGLLLGNGDGTFQPPISVAAGGPIAVADLNGDQKPDLVCGNGDVKVLLGNGDGTFQPAVTYNSDGGAASVSISDVNGDGKPDLLAGNGSVAVLLGNGDGSFQAAVTYSFGETVSPIVVADVNADGAPDVIGDDWGHKAVRVILGNGDGTFQPAEKFGSGGIIPRGAASADLNGDQKPDLLAVNYCFSRTNCGGTLGVLINIKVPTKTGVTTSGSPSHAGQPVTFTATVTPKYGGVRNGELMKFYDGTTLLSSIALVGGSASYTTSSLSVKTHTIKAIYVGDGIFKPSIGRVTQVVDP